MSDTPKRPDIGAVRRWAYSADRRTGACELGDVLAVCDWAEHLEADREPTNARWLKERDEARDERDEARNELADVKIEAGILRQDRDNCEVAHRNRLTEEKETLVRDAADWIRANGPNIPNASAFLAFMDGRTGG